jgi:hypothetical protein
VLGDAFGEHHVGHRLDDAEAVDPASYPGRLAFPGELVDQRHEPERPLASEENYIQAWVSKSTDSIASK